MVKAIIFDFNGVIYTDDYDRELLEFIKELKEKYKIGMISNYSQAGYDKYVVPIKDLFDEIVLSSQIGIHKPDPRIYQLAAKNLAVKPAECVYIDDEDYRVDGAVKAGMNGIIYKKSPKLKKELEKLLSPVADN